MVSTIEAFSKDWKRLQGRAIGTCNVHQTTSVPEDLSIVRSTVHHSFKAINDIAIQSANNNASRRDVIAIHASFTPRGKALLLLGIAVTVVVSVTAGATALDVACCAACVVGEDVVGEDVSEADSLVVVKSGVVAEDVNVVLVTSAPSVMLVN